MINKNGYSNVGNICPHFRDIHSRKVFDLDLENRPGSHLNTPIDSSHAISYLMSTVTFAQSVTILEIFAVEM